MSSFLSMRPGRCSRESEGALDSADSPVVRWEMLPAHIWNTNRMFSSNAERPFQIEPLAGIPAQVAMPSHLALSPRDNVDAAVAAAAQAAVTTAAGVEALLNRGNQGMIPHSLEDWPNSEVSSPAQGGNGGDSRRRNVYDGTEAGYERFESEMSSVSPFQEGGEWVLQDVSPRSTSCDDTAPERHNLEATHDSTTGEEPELFFEADVTDLGVEQELYSSDNSESDDYSDSDGSSGVESESDAEGDRVEEEEEENEIQEKGAEEKDKDVLEKEEAHEQKPVAAVGDMWHCVCPVHGLDGLAAGGETLDFEGSDADGWTDVGGIGIGGSTSLEAAPCSCLEAAALPKGPRQQKKEQLLKAAETEERTVASGAVLSDGEGVLTVETGQNLSDDATLEPQLGINSICSSNTGYGAREYSVCVTPEASEGSLSPQARADEPVAGRLQSLIASLEAQQWRGLLRANPDLVTKVQKERTDGGSAN
ncbi:hypothetical protein, conserved [Eimeria acervulina]|uniref:Uncharacterized protein n=1 Tax=Eimeria acervulina TaxID=5801 RepID=U6GU79_EIMAC|nr:hypothetical protein, conserved [Eimeria acervulina]CDI83821.1 hypothetical protein, conserved [Eimeria acervulina]